MQPINTVRIKRATALSISVLMSLAATATDVVKREILFSEDTLWVHDTLLISEKVAITEPALSDLYMDVQHGKTNISEQIKNLLSRDDLKLHSYTAEFSSNKLSLQIKSILKANENQGAKLRWTPTLGGRKISFPNFRLGDAGDELRVLRYTRNVLLSFPDLGKAEPQKLEEEMRVYNLVAPDSERYACTLKTGTSTTTLFEWNPCTLTNTTRPGKPWAQPPEFLTTTSTASAQI